MLNWRMQWNVVVSDEIEDSEQNLGVMNWPISFSSKSGLVQEVNRLREEDWLEIRNGLVHGRLLGKDVWAQEIIKISRDDESIRKWTIWDVVHSELIHDNGETVGLVSIVNERMEDDWHIKGQLMYSNHNGKDCWTIVMVKHENEGESESLM